MLCLATTAGTVFAQPAEDRWQVTVGGGIARTPKYPGSDEHRIRALPLVGVSYGRFFAGGEPGAPGGPGVGLNLLRDSAWRAGIALTGGFGKARKESDDPRLQGLGDIDRTVRAVAFGAYTREWLTARASVSTDIANKDQGTLVLLDLQGRYRATERLTLSAGPGLTWADSEYVQTFFGIDAAQSARSGRPVYEASGGLHAVRVAAGANYRIDRNWSVAGRLSVSRLRGDAAGSPITQDTTQYTTAIFAAYRF